MTQHPQFATHPATNGLPAKCNIDSTATAVIPPERGAGSSPGPTVGNHWHPTHRRQDAGSRGVPALEGSLFLWGAQAFFRPCSAAIHQSLSSLGSVFSSAKWGPELKALFVPPSQDLQADFRQCPCWCTECFYSFQEKGGEVIGNLPGWFQLMLLFSHNFLKIRFFPCTPHPPYRGKTKEEKWRNRLSFLPSQALSF